MARLYVGSVALVVGAMSCASSSALSARPQLATGAAERCLTEARRREPAAYGVAAVTAFYGDGRLRRIDAEAEGGNLDAELLHCLAEAYRSASYPDCDGESCGAHEHHRLKRTAPSLAAKRAQPPRYSFVLASGPAQALLAGPMVCAGQACQLCARVPAAQPALVDDPALDSTIVELCEAEPEVCAGHRIRRGNVFGEVPCHDGQCCILPAVDAR